MFDRNSISLRVACQRAELGAGDSLVSGNQTAQPKSVEPTASQY